MDDDGSKSEPKVGEVMPKEPDELAEVQQQTAVIRAIGEQVKSIAETPGIAAYLTGLGQGFATNAELALEAQKNQHILAMEREKNGAASQRRLQLTAAILLPVFGLMGLGATFGLAWMVHTDVITQSNAVTMGVVLTALFGWLNGQRKKTDEKK